MLVVISLIEEASVSYLKDEAPPLLGYLESKLVEFSLYNKTMLPGG